MSRWARNKDGNHAGIVRAFRACGASVSAIESAEAGVPDLVVGIYGLTELVEVKDGGSAQEAYAEAIAKGCSAERRLALDAALRAYCQRDTEAMIVLARRLTSA